MKTKYILRIACLLLALLMPMAGMAHAEPQAADDSLAMEWTERHEALLELAAELASASFTACEAADTWEEAESAVEAMLSTENAAGTAEETLALLSGLILPYSDPDGTPPALFALNAGAAEQPMILIGRTDLNGHASGLLIRSDAEGSIRPAAQLDVGPDFIRLSDRPFPEAGDESCIIVLNAVTGTLTGGYTLTPGGTEGKIPVIMAGMHPLPDGFELGVSEACMLSSLLMSTSAGLPVGRETGLNGYELSDKMNSSVLLHDFAGQAGSSFHLLFPDKADENAEWTSSNTSVITVDEDGFLHAIGAGRATVTVVSGDRTASVSLRVHPGVCPLCGGEINNASDFPAHHPAICGVEGHCAASGMHSAEPISRFCDAEPQHTVCEGDPEHICAGEYGCGEVYLCSESGKHATCIRCGKPWCWEGDEEQPVSHQNLECGYHRACEIPESDYDEHIALPCGHASCDFGPGFRHELLPCGEHYACRVEDGEAALHEALACGHMGCDETYAGHEALPCGEHLVCGVGAEGAQGHAVLSCGHAACDASYAGHETLPCGEHLVCGVSAEERSRHEALPCGHMGCDGGDHGLLPCGSHRACEVPDNEHGQHVQLACGHTGCEVSAAEHRLLACERHYACEIPADQRTGHGLMFCGHATCESYDGAAHAMLPCGEHLDCKVDPDKRDGHVMLSCGHAACSIGAGSDHGRGACGIHFNCQGGNHAVCPGCAQFFCSEGNHVPTECGHYACMPDLGMTHEKCGLCGGWLCGSGMHGTGACDTPSQEEGGGEAGQAETGLTEAGE